MTIKASSRSTECYANQCAIWKCLPNGRSLSRNPDLTMLSSSNMKFLLSGKCSKCIKVRHFPTFINFSTCAPYSGAFFCADQRGIVCFPKNVRFIGPYVTVFVGGGITIGTKTSKSANLYKWGLESFGMMRGFQIWPLNLNRVKFDTIFGKKAKHNFVILTVFFLLQSGSCGQDARLG